MTGTVVARHVYEAVEDMTEILERVLKQQKDEQAGEGHEGTNAHELFTKNSWLPGGTQNGRRSLSAAAPGSSRSAWTSPR